MSEIANKDEYVYVRGRPDRECEREVGKEKKMGCRGETNERENENRIKIVAERIPHFSFQPADSMPRDQTIRPDGFGRLSQLRARENDGRMMRRVRESQRGIEEEEEEREMVLE